MKTILDNIISYHERVAAPKRQRKRREADKRSFAALCRALAANAAYAVALDLSPPTVAISLAKPGGKRSQRYDAPGLGQLPSVLSLLSPTFVILRKSRRKGIASTIELGPEIVAEFSRFNKFGPQHFHREGAETIIVSRVVRDFASDIRTAHHVDYADNDETNRFHAELDRINRSLRSAQVDFIDDGGPRVETGRRLLRRIFNTPDDHPRFDLGGRLYGGWWQDIERSRRGNIRIDGHQTAYLDFSSMFLRLAYARASLQAPPSDLYAGILQTDLEGRYREGFKVVVNAMLFRSTPLQRLPKGSTELLPKGCTAASVRAAILRRHAPIPDQFEAGVGLSLMKLESDILIAILLRLIDLGIVALPVYDALIVRHDVAAQAATVMREEAKSLTGFDLPVKAIALCATY